MKDRYLFRGKRKLNGEWVEGSLIYGENDWAFIVPIGTEIEDYEHIRIRVITDSIGQFTGLTDKNGVKIFEGDIYKHPYSSEPEHFGFVVLFMGTSFVSANVFNQEESILNDYCIKCEIIGNIHENN